MIVRFEQDPNEKMGQGNFYDERGRASYTFDPDTASKFVSTMPGASGTPAPSLASTIATESSQMPAVQSVQKPVVTGQVAANEGATGTAAGLPGAGTQAVAPSPAPASKAQELAAKVSKVDQAAQLPVSGRTRTTNTTPGRKASDIARDKATMSGSTERRVDAVQDVAQARADRESQTARQGIETETGMAMGDMADLYQAGEDRRVSQTKLSDLLIEKDPELDPKRLINNLSTGQTIGLTILAALSGGFGATIGSKENPVLTAIGSAIEKDIDAQKKQIESGRIRRGNLIEHYRQMGMDAKSAETAARVSLRDGARRVAELQAKELGSQANLEDARLLISDLQSQNDRDMIALDQSGESRSTVSDTVERTAPKAVAVTADDLYKQGQLRQQQLEDMDAAEVAQVIAPTDAEGKPRNLSVKRAKEIVDGAKSIADKVPRFEVAENRIRQALTALGAPPEIYDPETGTIDWTAVEDLKGVGPLDSRPLINPLAGGPVGAALDAAGITQSDRKAVQEALIGIQEDLTYATTGASATTNQQETFRTQSGQNMKSEKSVKENLARTAQTLATQKSSILSGDKDAAKLYQHTFNRGAVSSLKPGLE